MEAAVMSSARDPDEIDKINKIISELNLEKAKKAGLASPLTFIPASLQTWSKQAARDTDAVLQGRVKDALEAFTGKLKGLKEEATSQKDDAALQAINAAEKAVSKLPGSQITSSPAMTFSASKSEQKAEPTPLEAVTYGGEEVEKYLDSVKEKVNKKLSEYIEFLMDGKKGGKNETLQRGLIDKSKHLMVNVNTLDGMEKLINEVKDLCFKHVKAVDERQKVAQTEQGVVEAIKVPMFQGKRAVKMRNDYMKADGGGKAIFNQILGEISKKKDEINDRFIAEMMNGNDRSDSQSRKKGSFSGF